MLVCLFRHGETDWNVARRMQGHVDIPLNENGLAQARTVAAKIGDIYFDAVFASPLIRAKTTAQILLGDETRPVQTDKRLIEIGFGVEEGVSIEHVVQDETDPLHRFIVAPHEYDPPEGAESLEEVWARFNSFFEEVLVPLEKKLSAEKEAGQTAEPVAELAAAPSENEPKVLVVAHGAAIRALTCRLAGRSYDQFWGNVHMSNLALNLIRIKDGQITLLEEAKKML